MDNQNKKEEQKKPESQDAAKAPETPAAEPTPTTEPVPPAESPAVPAEPETPAAPAEAETATDMSAEPSPQPIAPEVGYTETKSNKLVYILVGILLVILLSLVGLFFYKQMSAAPAETQISPSPVQVSPTDIVSPTATPANEEEAALQQIDIPDIDQDLQQIESDVDQL